ncbi:protein ASPARTIC PROTEASE IN GUARD CELL 1-like [Cucurbita moschata]|uniref:Protein ASPARTIC PROTEASE IN GUARD CELL 1-like n=1 Tax=Cucurbita moschata TaxID=3662 RepID=A0A6J1GS20_CUCMO|nr:protein ASPARTIC PROTEASE IN GUARD CELL 1-like [Cucurbita moschata]
MASARPNQLPFFPFAIFLFLFLSLFPFTLSSSSSSSSASLDVSTSLKQAHQVLKFGPKILTSFHQQELLVPANSSSSSFSLQLHPRDALRNAGHTDYRSLVLSRLDRDSSRVKSLNDRLEFGSTDLTRSDLQPLNTDILPEDLSTPIVSGSSQGSGEYFSRVGVGQPAKPFYMVLDTGSDINWLQCQPCTDCYQQTDPIFDPTTSSSFTSLPCESPHCQALEMSGCRAAKCLYQVSYGDGSFTVGQFVTETLSFGNSGVINNVALGCGHDNEGLFIGSAGLLGLGGGSLSLNSQMKASSFSYCLVDRDSGSASTLEFNSAAPNDSVNAQLLRSGRVNTFYYVALTGLSVGGHPLSIPPSLFQLDDSGHGGIIVDSGTAITRLQTQAYNSLRDAFVRLTPYLKKANSFALFDTCYDLSSQSRVTIPTVSFHFSGGKSLQLPPKNYLIPVDSAGTFCFAFAPTTSSLSIIGNVQQQGTRVNFDLANSVVAFSPNKC